MVTEEKTDKGDTCKQSGNFGIGNMNGSEIKDAKIAGSLYEGSNNKAEINPSMVNNVSCHIYLHEKVEETVKLDSRQQVRDKDCCVTQDDSVTFSVVGSVENIDAKKLKSILRQLKILSKDASIVVDDIELGSIKFILSGSQEGLERLEALFRAGELSEIEGLPIENVQFLETQTFRESKKVKTNERKQLAFTLAGDASQADIAKLKSMVAELDNKEASILQKKDENTQDTLNLKKDDIKERKKTRVTDDELMKIINNICDNPNANRKERRININRFLIYCMRLPGLLKSSHPLYLEALDNTFEEMLRNIYTFKPNPNLTVQESLVRWINSYLRNWTNKIYLLSEYRQQRRLSHELSLDVSVDDNSKNPTILLDPLIDSEIEDYIEKERNQNFKEIFEQLERYVEEDPEHIFQNSYPRGYPNCNYQLICQRLLFKDPPDKLKDISREFNIKYDTLRSHWQRKCLPLLQNKLKELGYPGDEEL